MRPCSTADHADDGVETVDEAEVSVHSSHRRVLELLSLDRKHRLLLTASCVLGSVALVHQMNLHTVISQLASQQLVGS
jgi:hypothetical protein